jgi:predicted nucleic acid-binding protein
VLPILRRDPEAVVWWGSRVECASALARMSRGGEIAERLQHDVRRRLAALWRRFLEVQPGAELRERAVRLLNLHPLRAADALQLAAALEWCGEETSDAGFVCLDGRLRAAAAREGFDVHPFPEEVSEP